MRRLKQKFVIFLILCAFLVQTIPVKAQNYMIDGDVVYIDDSNAYLAIYPANAQGGYVYFNFTSKNYSGDIDLIFGFDSEVSRPDGLELYKPRNVTTEHSYTIPDVYFTDPAYMVNWTFAIQDAQNFYNGTAFLWYTNETTVLVKSQDYDVANKQTKTLYWQTTVFKEWLDLAKRFDWNINYFEFQGYDKWYMTQCNVSAGVEYHSRVLLHVLPSLEHSTVKYWVAIKPADETLSESISNGHFYALDPWLDAGWDHRVKLTIPSASIDEDLTDFPILLKISNSSGTNSEDLGYIFDEIEDFPLKIAVTTEDGETELFAEVEYWNKTEELGYIWVKVPTLYNTADNYLYLYYDGDHINNVARVGYTGEAVSSNVWNDDYVMVHHMSDNSTSTILDSTLNNNDGTKKAINEPIEAEGKIGKAQDFNDIDDYIRITDSADFKTQTLTLSAIFISNSTDGEDLIYAHYLFTGGFHNGIQFTKINNNIRFFVFDGAGHEKNFDSSGLSLSDGNPHHIFVVYNNRACEIYVDGSKVVDSTWSYDITFPSYDINIGSRTFNALVFDGVIDEIQFSEVARSGAWVGASYETQTDNLIVYGETMTETETETGISLVFQEFLFGEGAFLGLMIVAVGGILTVSQVRAAGIIFILISAMICIQVLTGATSGDSAIMAGIGYALLIPFFLLMMVLKRKNGF